MIYLFHGKDTYRSKHKLTKEVSSLKGKGSNFSFFNIEEDNFSTAFVEELIRSQSLFEKKNVAVLSRVFENLLARDFIIKKIKEISESPNIFIFWEEEMKKPVLDEISNYINKAQEFKILERPKVQDFLREKLKEKGIKIDFVVENEIIEKYGADLWGIKSEVEKIFLEDKLDVGHLSGRFSKIDNINIFHLTDAFGEKNKRGAWVLYHKALLSGLPVEEVFWKLTWQVKNILLVKRMSEELRKNKEEVTKESGLNPFVVKNCLNFAKNFDIDKLNTLYLDLIDIFYRIRTGRSDFDTSIEKFLLSY